MEGLLHEIWKEPDGTTGCFLEGERSNEARSLLEKGSRLIHTFYAKSHFEAMTIYYKYMGWGDYKTSFEIDKQPYTKSNDHE
jgi:hypothetical protein